MAEPISGPFGAALAGLLMAASLAACAQPAEEADGSNAAGNDSRWQVSLSVSGGIAGIAQEFRADSETRMLIATDQRRNRTVTRMLDEQQVRELEALLDLRGNPREQGGTGLRDQPGARCADCLQYSLLVQQGANKYQARYDSMTLGSSTDEELINRLVTLGRQTLAQ